MGFDYKKYLAEGGVNGHLLTENVEKALAKAEGGKPLTDEEKQALKEKPLSVADLVTNARMHYLLGSLPELVKNYGIKFIPHRKPFKGVEPLHVALFLKHFKDKGLMDTNDLKGKWFYTEDETFKKQIPSTAQEQGLSQGALEAALQILKK